MTVANSTQFIAQVVSMEGDFGPVVKADLSLSRYPDGSFITVKGEVQFADSRRVEVREAVTVEEYGAPGERLTHRTRFPSTTFARRFKFVDGATHLVRLEDDIHGLHYHFDDSGKACCSRGMSRVELSDGPGAPLADRFCILDFVGVLDRTYYSGRAYFCKEFTSMGLIANGVR